MASPRFRRPFSRSRWARLVTAAATATLLWGTAVEQAEALLWQGRSAAAARQQPSAASCSSPSAPVHYAPARGSSRTVALTFDDGPGEWTRPILDVLDRERVRATFFVVGQVAQARQETLREIVRRGHLLGNHSWSHPTPHAAGWDDKTLTAEIERTQQLVQAATGVRPCFFRPPYGATPGALPVTGRAGLTLALWSVDTRDWAQRPGDQAAPQRIRASAAEGLRQARPVVLMHDGGGDRRNTLAALSGVIADYRARGYRFVRLDGTG